MALQTRKRNSQRTNQCCLGQSPLVRALDLTDLSTRIFVLVKRIFVHSLHAVIHLHLSNGDNKTLINKNPSELAFDSHGVLCQANELCFNNDLKVKKLETIQCGELSTAQIIPIGPDLVASGVNSTTFHAPFHLCKFHHEVYLSLRNLEPCSKSDCHYGYPKSQGPSGLCKLHTTSNEKQIPQVSFLDPGGEKGVTSCPTPQGSAHLPYYDGLTSMSPTLIRQSILECLDLGLKTELEVAKHLTILYGGLLTENAALTEQHWPITGASRNQTTTTTTTNGPLPVQDVNCSPPHYIFSSTNTPRDVAGSAPAGLPGDSTLPSTQLPAQPNSYSPFVHNRVGNPTVGVLPQATPFVPHPHASFPAPPGHPPFLSTQPSTQQGSNFAQTPYFIPPQPQVNPPLRLPFSDATFQSTVCHHLDRIAHPDTGVTAKQGTFESIKRIDEIWVYCARGFDTLPVQLCPGIVG